MLTKAQQKKLILADIDAIKRVVNSTKVQKLSDGTSIEYSDNLQIRKSAEGEKIVQYIQTTTGRVILNYTIQKTLNFL